MVSVSKDICLQVGALGNVFFRNGLYAYVGSAQRNLEKRIERHLKRNKKKFWHIDYLTSDNFVGIVGVFLKKAEKSEECRVAAKLSESEVPIENFGCSDCGCTSHLFLLSNLARFMLDSSKSGSIYLEECISPWSTGRLERVPLRLQEPNSRETAFRSEATMDGITR